MSNFLNSPDTKGTEDPRFANHASHEANQDKWAVFPAPIEDITPSQLLFQRNKI